MTTLRGRYASTLIAVGALLGCGLTQIAWTSSVRPSSHTNVEIPQSATAENTALKLQVKEHMQKGRSAWMARDFPAAASQFGAAVELDPANVEAHSEFIRATIETMKVAHTRLEQEQKRGSATGAAGEEIAKEAREWDKRVDQMRVRYEHLANGNPSNALYPYALSVLSAEDLIKKEQYLRKALALNPKFAEAYYSLSDLKLSVGDKRACLEYLKKALDYKPDEGRLLFYARILYSSDRVAGRKLLEDIIAKNAGTERGVQAMNVLVQGADGIEETVASVERMRKEYPPAKFVASRSAMGSLFEAYMKSDKAKALVIAREMLSLAREGFDKNSWRERVDYLQNLSQAREMMEQRKFREAYAVLDKTVLPRSIGPRELVLLKAEAMEGAGDVAKAYAIMMDALVPAPDEAIESALQKYGAKLQKTSQEMSTEIWAKRLQNAPIVKAFELSRLENDQKVRLSDYRGKVVLVDFWYPG